MCICVCRGLLSVTALFFEIVSAIGPGLADLMKLDS